jgi:hypothetical protein
MHAAGHIDLVIVDGDGSVAAGCDARATACAKVIEMQNLRESFLTFRIAAPTAGKGATFEKDSGSDARSVMQ